MGAVLRRSAVSSLPHGQRRHRPDYWLLLLSALLLATGLIVVYAISPGLAVEKNVGENYFINKQFVAIGLGLVAFLVAAHMPLDAWKRLQTPMLVAAALATVAVRAFGEEVNGAYRWIQVGGMSFQAVELIKFALLIWLAGFLAAKIREGMLGDYRQALRPLLFVLGIIGVVVAGVQSDLGSTGVMIAMMAAMAFVAGLPMRRILTIGGIVVVVLVLAVATSDYRQERLMTYLHPTQDCMSTGWQACQALIAVGSGGMVGLGLGRSVQAFGYLPEAENDSIFAIYAEKFGFLGVTVLLGLFIALFSRIKRLMERAPDDFTRLLAVGVFAWFTSQTVINIGAMVGLLPLKGITLPFISAGGTSVVFVMAAVGLLFQLSRYTLYSVPRNSNVSGSTGYENRSDRRRVRGAYYPRTGSRP
jgi:cell division protein FtsW